jgi:tight adherence protein B
MMLPLLLTGGALGLIAVALELWWRAGHRQQQQAVAQHVDAHLLTAVTAAGGAAAGKRKTLPYWAGLLKRAGLDPTLPRLLMLVVPGVIVGLAAGVRLGSAWFGAFSTLLYYVVLSLWLHRRIANMQRKILSQLPDFLENMVRLTGIGNSLAMALQSATQNVSPPLRPILDNALNYSRAGMDLDRALQQASQGYDLQPLEVLSVVLGTSIRIGGRTDQVLQRMSDFMRDMEEVQRELQATTSETRMSAWVLGLLPIACGVLMALMDPGFFKPMFEQDLGKQILLIALGLEIVGAFLIYRLARSL